MSQTIELTLEQEFSLSHFIGQVQQMSREQAQEMLIEQQRLMLMQEATYHQLLRHEWNLD